jgi:hypothetical protein
VELNFNDGQAITNPILEVNGTAAADKGFKSWRLEFGSGEDPDSWTVLAESDKPVEDGTLTVWNLTGAPNGIVTLRLTLIGENAEVDKRVRLNLSLPIPTVPSSTPTATPTATETPTQIIVPPTETPTLTPFPTDTPTETPTPP